MKQLIIACVCVAISTLGYPQNSDPVPYFFSTIVKNMDRSAAWYRNVFELTVSKTESNETYGYKVVIFESETLMIELMELKASVSSNELLAGKYAADTKLQGHFKFGFKVQEMDALLSRLKNLGVKVDNIWKDDKTGKRNFLINDPDGNIIQFFE